MAARRSPDEAVLTALIARLTSQTTSASYTEVPQGTEAPYVKLTLPTGRRMDSFGRFGASTLVDVIAITAGASQLTGLRMRSAAITALDNQRLALTGHTMLGTAWDTNEYFAEMVQGVKYHHHVATIRVWTEQSTT
jgi:hypothetical protein